MPKGTLTADGTEQTVFTTSVGYPGELFFYIDLENMATGDTTVIRLKADVDGDGTYELISSTTYSDAQSEPVVFDSGLMVTSDVPARLTLEQTGGTNRDYPWAYGVKH